MPRPHLPRLFCGEVLGQRKPDRAQRPGLEEFAALEVSTPAD